ncbi:hypothetical protein BKA93DRAFT_44474 [Sparassis latifolia]
MIFFKYFLVFSCLTAAALAQTVWITAPAGYDSFSPGENFTVQITRPQEMSGADEVAIVIALESCAGWTGGCAEYDVTQVLGTVLYQGPYAPVFQTPGEAPYQNFTVQVPSYMAAGQASLSCSRFALLGGGLYPNLEVKNITLDVI